MSGTSNWIIFHDYTHCKSITWALHRSVKKLILEAQLNFWHIRCVEPTRSRLLNCDFKTLDKSESRRTISGQVVFYRRFDMIASFDIFSAADNFHLFVLFMVCYQGNLVLLFFESQKRQETELSCNVIPTLFNRNTASFNSILGIYLPACIHLQWNFK